MLWTQPYSYTNIWLDVKKFENFFWIPACAGMTTVEYGKNRRSHKNP